MDLGGGGSVGGGSIVAGLDSGLSSPINQQQQLMMNYLAAMNSAGGGASDAPTGQQQQELLDLFTANSQLMESMMGGTGLGMGSSDLFAQMTNSLMNASAGGAANLLPPQYPNYMPMMNSTFHKEFLKQIANVQKEQGSGGGLGGVPVPGRRSVGRPPASNGGGGEEMPSGRSSLGHVSAASKSRDLGGSQRFACDYCHKTFASRYYLATHIQVHLSQLSPEERKQQMRVIRSPEQLRLLERAEERQRFLQGHKPQQGSPQLNGSGSAGAVKQEFKCVKCVAMFSDEDEYKQHLAVHAGERPLFHCQNCNKTYRYEGAFESHRCGGKIGEYTSWAVVSEG